MANMYETITSLTAMPGEQLTATHRLLLEGCGFEVAEDGGGNVYWYTTNAEALWGGSWTVDSLTEREHASPGTDALRGAVLAELTPDTTWGWQEVLQRILRDLPESITHLDMQGAFWCDSELRASFGGLATRITRESISGINTADWFEEQPTPIVSADEGKDPGDSLFVNVNRFTGAGSGCLFVVVQLRGLAARVERLAAVSRKLTLAEIRAEAVDAEWVASVGGTNEFVSDTQLVVSGDRVRWIGWDEEAEGFVETEEMDVGELCGGIAAGQRCFGGSVQDVNFLCERVRDHADAMAQAATAVAATKPHSPGPR